MTSTAQQVGIGAADEPKHQAVSAEDVARALETASRILKNIAKPQESDGATVVYCVSDDVPEDIYAARSYVDHALALLRPLDDQGEAS